MDNEANKANEPSKLAIVLYVLEYYAVGMMVAALVVGSFFAGMKQQEENQKAQQAKEQEKIEKQEWTRWGRFTMYFDSSLRKSLNDFEKKTGERYDQVVVIFDSFGESIICGHRGDRIDLRIAIQEALKDKQ